MQSNISESDTAATRAIPLRGVSHAAIAKTAAERAKAYRARKKAVTKLPGPRAGAAPPQGPDDRERTPIAPLRHSFAPEILSAAALSLAGVGVAMNGWFAQSLGSSDAAGWLFLAVGVAADLIALIMPSCAAALWRSCQRARALAGWTVWLVTFAFAVTAGVGFTSTNISDVTLARASRVTPAVTAARAALADAMSARDRECKGGVGKFCREREADVIEQRRVVDGAARAVDQASDPQTGAAIRLVAWVTRGLLHPAPDDFVMFRLLLLAVLPQIGGILLMIGRR